MSVPFVPVVARGAGGLFGLLARGLGGRPLHPVGAAFHATLEVPGPTAPELELFAESSRRPAIVRFSRGFGLPDPLPEILSLAVKIPGAYGPGRDGFNSDTTGGGLTATGSINRVRGAAYAASLRARPGPRSG